MSTCKHCRAPILWVETEAKENKPARKMPLDGDPANPGYARLDPKGNVVLVGQAGDGTPIARYVPAGRGRHVSHFATCEARKTKPTNPRRET